MNKPFGKQAEGVSPDTDLRNVSLHPNHPAQVWVVVEQTPDEPNRINYDSDRNAFMRTEYKSLCYERGFSGVYGWIGGTGMPPSVHYDVFLFTGRFLRLGDVLQGHICGMYWRKDGDHKFVAVDDDLLQTMKAPDLKYLGKEKMVELLRLYPNPRENERWCEAEIAINHLSTKKPTHV